MTTNIANGEIPTIHVAPSPHITDSVFTTRRMMADVLIALLPMIFMSIYVFKYYAVKQLALCLLSCLGAEALFVKIRDKAFTLTDLSAAVTAIILALSLPGTAPWYVGVIASVVAISIGKIIFGGLGMNIFNPAMVGRAFVMICFAGVMGAAAYISESAAVDAITKATPMETLKQTGETGPIAQLFWGLTNGSIGETSAIAAIIGGLYLCVRRTASWEIPTGIILVVVVIAGIADIAGSFSGYFVMHHFLGGGRFCSVHFSSRQIR